MLYFFFGISIMLNIIFLAIIKFQKDEIENNEKNAVFLEAINNADLDTFERVDHFPGGNTATEPPKFRQLVTSVGRRNKSKSFDRG